MRLQYFVNNLNFKALKLIWNANEAFAVSGTAFEKFHNERLILNMNLIQILSNRFSS